MGLLDQIPGMFNKPCVHKIQFNSDASFVSIYQLTTTEL